MKKILNALVCEVFVLVLISVLLIQFVNAQELVTNPLDELLPPRIYNPGHDPTNPLQEPEWYFGNSWSETLTEPDFMDGRAVQYYKRYYGYSDMSVEFYVYRFSNLSSADLYFSKEINQINFEGEFTQIPISDSFAILYDNVTQKIGISFGVIKNIVFKVKVITINIVEDPTDQLIEFTLLERDYILGTSQIPEFPSSSILSLIVITVPFIFMIYKKRNPFNMIDDSHLQQSLKKKGICKQEK